MAIIFTILFAVLYVTLLIFWNKKVKRRLPLAVSGTIKWIHYLAALVSAIVIIVFMCYSIGLRGLWTTRILVITALITGIFFLFVADKKAIGRIEFWYFKLFSFFPVLISAILLIPFIGIVLVMSMFGQLFSPARKIYVNDKHLRIQSSFVGVLAGPEIKVYRKYGLFEEQIPIIESFNWDLDSVNVVYEKDSTVILLYDAGYNAQPYKLSIEKIE